MSSTGVRSGRPPGPRRSREERRKELLDAAERAIRRIGPGAVMDELAAEAGITKPILYSHFGDRAGLAAALAERTSTALIAEVNGALQSATSSGSARTVASAGIMAFCDFVERDPNIYRFLVQNTLGDTNPMQSRLLTEIASGIAKLLGRALRDIGVDSGAAEPWAFGIVGFTVGGVEWWLDRRMMPKHDVVEYLTDLLWNGLAGIGLGDAGLQSQAVDLSLGDAAPEATVAPFPSPGESASAS
jgi:AcrR family transcriptional regulator